MHTIDEYMHVCQTVQVQITRFVIPSEFLDQYPGKVTYLQARTQRQLRGILIYLIVTYVSATLLCR